MTQKKSWSYSEPPLGLPMIEAACYIGVGPTKFVELVRKGLMPRPKRIGDEKRWDRSQLDIHFKVLPDDGTIIANVIDIARRKKDD